MTAWALAVLRTPVPDGDWAAAWCAAAEATAPAWGPQALAHGLAAVAALQMQPPAPMMEVSEQGALS
jgi:hypothetical protein